MKREQALQIHGFASDVGPTTPPLEILFTSSHDHLEVTTIFILKMALNKQKRFSVNTYTKYPTKRQSLTLFLIFAIISGISAISTSTTTMRINQAFGQSNEEPEPESPQAEGEVTLQAIVPADSSCPDGSGPLLKVNIL